MDQEERIREIEKLICKHSQILKYMDINLRPMYLEWREDKEDEDTISRMILDE